MHPIHVSYRYLIIDIVNYFKKVSNPISLAMLVASLSNANARELPLPFGSIGRSHQ